jgi:hypothetical protein
VIVVIAASGAARTGGVVECSRATHHSNEALVLLLPGPQCKEIVGTRKYSSANLEFGDSDKQQQEGKDRGSQ